MLRSLLLASAIALLSSCGGPAAPPGPSVAPIGSVGPAPVRSGPKREPSAETMKHWPFRGQPELVVYADLRGFLQTDVMKDIVPGLLSLAKTSLSDEQVTCIRELSAAVREVLVGANDELGVLGIVRFDPT